MVKVFVYGTLLRGMERSQALDHARFLGHALTEGMLYDLGSFPAILKGDSPVFGELYEASDNELRRLDAIEGFRQNNPAGSLYVREEVSVVALSDGWKHQAFAYFYNGRVDPRKRIECGDYRRYLLETSCEEQWYIAYGSNMSRARLKGRIGHDPMKTEKGYLEGYRLVFNKRADKGGSYANVVYVGNDSKCPFVAYLISMEQLRTLDTYEGKPSHYVRLGIPFSAQKGKTWLGHIYIANPDRLTDRENPSKKYLGHIHTGYKDHGFDVSGLPPI
ncbi:MAG: gamma-glutamylcyclotransferase [Desulfomonilaceae bacterium]